MDDQGGRLSLEFLEDVRFFRYYLSKYEDARFSLAGSKSYQKVQEISLPTSCQHCRPWVLLELTPFANVGSVAGRWGWPRRGSQ